MSGTGQGSERTADPGDHSDGTAQDSLDFLTFGRMVERKAEDFYERVEDAYGEIVLLATDFHWESAADIVDHELEVPTSTDGLVATLQAIGTSAEQLAEQVTTLGELRLRHLFERAATERRP